VKRWGRAATIGALRPGGDAACVQRAGDAVHLAPAGKQDHRRDRTDAIARGQRLFAFGIDLQQPYRGFECLRGRGERRRHHLAWTAPFGPEIDQHRQRAFAHVPIERGQRGVHRLAGEQRRLAFAAGGCCVSRPCGTRLAAAHRGQMTIAASVGDIRFVRSGNQPFAANWS
jgi:hypothetical protein